MGRFASSYSAFSSLWRFSPLLRTVRRTLSLRRSPPLASPGRRWRRRERRKAGRTSQQRNQEREGKERRKAGKTGRTNQQRNQKKEGKEGGRIAGRTGRTSQERNQEKKGKEGRGPTRTDLEELLLES